MTGKLHTEEDVKVQFLLPYLNERGYKTAHCEFEKAIEVQEGRKRKKIFADVIVYTSNKHETPLICCETKPPNEVLDNAVKDQAISYARLLPKIAPLALITNGSQVQVFQTLNKNRIVELPQRKSLAKDFLNFLISNELRDALRDEAKHELFIIDDVQSFKRILKSCHNEIRNNEGYDPTKSFDELSKVLFCKLHDEKHSASARFRTGVFDETLSKLGINVVRQIFEETKVDPLYLGLFEPSDKIELQDRTIRKMVSLFENVDLSLTAFDVKGEAFEYFLGDTFTGGLGQYFTPRNVVQFMVEALDPKIGERIIDPFCGTGGFLIYAFDLVSDKIRLQEFSEAEKERWRLELSNRSLFGTDWIDRTSQACKMNMTVHGDGSAGIFKHHGLVDVPNQDIKGAFDICITNPPFGSVENDPDVLNLYELGSGRNSQDRVILALERAITLVKPGGWIGIVVIDGILNNRRTSYVRDYIRQQVSVRAVVSLSSDTFEGYGGRSNTSVLLMQRKAIPDQGSQEPTLMAIASNTGYAPNGDQVPGNQLPDILLDYRSFARTGAVPGVSNSWITTLGDRFDPASYVNAEIETTDHVAIAAQISTLLRSTNEDFQKVQQELSLLVDGLPMDEVRLDQVLDERRDRVQVESNSIYGLLGVRWWGGGAFLREEKRGRDIKASTVYRVRANELIYNRLFAFRGSFAMVAEDQGGCYVSGEFPTFAVRSEYPRAGVPLVRYLVHSLNSPAFLAMIDAQSTGSTKTSRNRFMQEGFRSVKVSVPRDDVGLLQIVEALDLLDDLRGRQQVLLETMKQFRESVTSLLPGPSAG